jgi:hypothetical protein
MCGYDIACAFWKTLMESRLGPKARELSFHMIVSAFHGHAHNRGCQLNWHPLYVEGTGRADYEGCERIFHSSNDLAPGTRYATTFHRRQAIEEHFTHWDEDKYASQGLNYFFWHHWLVLPNSQGHFYSIIIVKRF